jgi:small subunit ribosomal protein S20
MPKPVRGGITGHALLGGGPEVDNGVFTPQNTQLFSRFIVLGRSTLANSAQARKRARQAETHRQHNASRRRMMRTELKRVVKAIATGDKQSAAEAYKQAVPVIDRIANQGLIHKNKAARHKSRLNAQIKAL